jgi:L-histidine N-alpha-methyltransferase
MPGAPAADVTIVRGRGASGENTLADDVRHGLTARPKTLPPKHFYDARGSELYERITTVPEYYPARSEREILNRRAPELTAGARELVELGSGMASKTRALLYAMAGSGALERYVPFDVDESVVVACADELVDAYPGLTVHGVVGDFASDLGLIPPGQHRVFAFLGGTVGNLLPHQRAAFLGEVAGLMGPTDALLLGTDLVKDRATLEAAYDDAQGVTAEFNRNVLHVVNRELGADFDPAAFEHVSAWVQDESRIEMRLRAPEAISARIPSLGLVVDFAAGEEMRTEVSCKFTPEAVAEELDAAGLRMEAFHTDSEGLFALSRASLR